MFKIRVFFSGNKDYMGTPIQSSFQLQQIMKKWGRTRRIQNCYLSDFLILTFFNAEYIQFRIKLGQNPLAWLAVVFAGGPTSPWWLQIPWSQRGTWPPATIILASWCHMNHITRFVSSTRHFQMHFLELNCINFGSDSTEVCYQWPN